MDALPSTTRPLFLLTLLLLSRLSHAQTDSEKVWLARTEVRSYPTYFEKITYNGKHQEYYTVATYLKDSTLYRVDNYKLIINGNAYRYDPANAKQLIRQGPAKIMYPGGQTYLAALYDQNQLNGPFIVYYSDGAVKRKELYHRGYAKESHCYGPDGQEQTCPAFYELPQFTGNQRELKSYLESCFRPIFTSESLSYLQVEWTINEIGQISRTRVVANQVSPKLVSAVEQVVRNMPHWNAEANDWKPAQTDGVPISEIWTFRVYYRNGFLYVSFT